MARSYVVDIAGGTATATIQIQGAQTLRNCVLSFVNAAAGKIEISLSGTSQIGTAQPDNNVQARVSCGGTAGQTALHFPINIPVKAFQSLYVHCTGVGLGTATFS